MNENDDATLMPPPPPRLLKRQKTETSANDVVAAAGESVLATSVSTRPDSIFIKTSGSLSTGNNARAVSPDDFENNSKRGTTVSPSQSAQALAAANGFGDETAPKSPRCLESSSFSKISRDVRESLPRDDYEDVSNDAIAEDGAFHGVSSPEKMSSRNDFGPSTNHRARNEISETESNRDGQRKKSKQSRECGSPMNVSFRDIIGHGQAKLRLDEALLPLALPPDLRDSVLSGIRAAPASILLHGPPGCGKTKLAKAVAGEAQAAFLSVGPSDILSKFVGESEASIRGLFREARKKARNMESKCAVVFFDEIDALGRSRVDEDSGKMSQAGGDNSSRRVLAELLIQMTDLSNGNGEGESGSDSEGDEGEEYDGYCGDGDSFAGHSTISTGTGSFARALPDDLGARPTSPMSSSIHSDAKAAGENQISTLTAQAGAECNIDSDKTQQPKPRVIVVAATNRPEDCDPALLRRFAVRVLVGLPSRKDRKKIIRRLLSDVEHSITGPQLNELALATEGWSGSDLESMTREAVMAPVRECLREAAILKKQTQEQKRADDAHNATRDSLLNSFRNLRPVSAKDFAAGIAFFLGDQQDGSSSEQAHYDSSSSEDEE